MPAPGSLGVERPVLIVVQDTWKALGDLAGWWRHQHAAWVVALTGSAGKTTTKEMIAGILALEGPTLKSPGNFNNLAGLPLALLQLERRHAFAVVEMGMNRAGEIARLTEIADPDVGLITNVGMAHLEELGSLEAVAAAKWELVDQLAPRASLILNGDDPQLMSRARIAGRPFIAFGTAKRHAVSGRILEDRGLRGLRIEIRHAGKSWEAALAVPGRQNLWNALAAAAVGFSLELPGELIVSGLEQFGGLEGRFRVKVLPGGVILVDDSYNANPTALQWALDSLASLRPAGGRLILGLGDMLELGAATAAAHHEAGRRAGSVRPHLFLVTGTRAQEMLAGAREAGLAAGNARVAETREEMASRILTEVRPGDVVFIKGSRRTALDRVVRAIEEHFAGG